MPSTKSIKQRIRSVKNTAQITKAMEAVSATKMRKAQGFALIARPYAVASLQMLQNLLLRTEILPPLLQKRGVKTSALLVITSDKGLAGSFNANVLKKAEAWVESKKSSGASYVLLTVGKKARDYFTRRGIAAEKSFWGFGDFSELKDTLPVAEEILQGFLSGRWDEVEAIYTNFRTTLKQEAVLKKILPVTKEGIEEIVEGILPEKGKYAEVPVTSYSASIGGPRQSRDKLQVTSYNYEYKLEPSPEEILNKLVPQLLQMHIHHLILESNASEHSARMVAMKNASDKAGELIDELTLSYNKLRQAGITRELTEITAGREALEN